MSHDPLTGRIVDSRYEVGQRVARGGMATVYKAYDRRLERDVALKLMHPHLADSPDFVARFRREARAAARLSNPGVVAVYDQGAIDGVAYIIMEYVPGPTLRDRIASGPLTVAEALEMTSHVLRPLGAAHRAGLMHRDIKPENVLLPADGSVPKVADFGLARAVTEATQTSTGNILGTVAYLAPELITSGASTPRADVYSVGVMLFELLTGEQPFSADTPIQIAFRNVHEDIPAPSTRADGIPVAIDRLVAAMTARDPQERLANADDALRAVREAAEAVVEDAGPASPAGASGAAEGSSADGPGSARSAGSPGSADGAGVPIGAASPAGASGPLSAGVTASAATPAESSLTARLPSNPLDPGAVTPSAGMRTVSLPIGSISSATGEGADGAEDPDARAAGLLGRRLLIAGGALAVLGAVGGTGAWYFVSGPGRRVRVPRIEGLSAEEASAAVSGAELVWAEPTTVYSDSVPAGTVISATPAGGTSVTVGARIQSVVSLGIEQKTVPDVVGKTEHDAQTAIIDAGLTVGQTSREHSSSVATGMVISTDPAAGQSLDKGAVVNITISKGRASATVPDVVGKTEEEARKALESAGLEMSATRANDKSVKEGRVISQSPKKGASGVYKGDAVALVISQGPKMIAVPDVTGKSESEAKKALKDAGFEVEVDKAWTGHVFGEVDYTRPAKGEQAAEGSKVVVRIK
ncbi:serine/threonine protein kinase [Actinomyces denticolens]|uniref:non-specific serine/threonine protein kinase n=1 Tax=Actinomyces denticolens TaxID=52767 RepID=A0ABY1I4G2_9ACTO|nr:Stk1 family PASTA domain-containing Ser/Thr kinase [Actinomyces denticolens]SHI59018.1 serine/threonine protein kinase [Actinomyces denticolens]